MPVTSHAFSNLTAPRLRVAAGRSAVVAAALGLTALAAGAQTMPAPQNVLNLQASASVEVARDMMSVTYAATRDGVDAAGVQSALKQALEVALAEARKAAKPQQIEVRTGTFSLYPRYSTKGAISGWQGTAELTVEGRDMAGIAQLAGRIQTMVVQRVGYALSPEARDKVQADVSAQAIARFQAKAQEMARQFGFKGVSIREVNVNTDEATAPMPMMRMRAAAAPMADESLPTEPGKGTVTSTVSGSVQMTP